MSDQPEDPPEPRPLSRRAFLSAAAATTIAGGGIAALIGLTRKAPRTITGGFADDGAAAAHALLRDGRTPPDAPRKVERVPIVIVGGGVAGLSAAWWLERAGMRSAYVLLEMARETGGNARAGANDISAYPLGAHYLPLPGPEATHVRMLLAEMGLLLPDGSFAERDLCHAPRERIFAHGRWTDGIEGALAVRPGDREALARFAEDVAALRATGAFTIPMARGARAGHPLDAMTAEAWLAANGYRSEAVRWLVDYACRDDYGTRARDASAWAALHYFATREGGDDAGPLTWPEGNARLVRHLAARAGDRVVTGAPVSRVERHGRGLRVRAGDVAWECDAVVFAAPMFVASRVVEDAPRLDDTHAPWLVANLTLDRWPAERARDRGEGPGPAWDNVLLDSPALGYVVATHQAMALHQERTVWTHYAALCDEAPRAARQRLLASDWQTLADGVLDDLARAHPDIRDCVAHVELMRHGHAMPRPVPGFLARRAALWEPARDARVFWAHSDVSGLSLFEEAQQRGIAAAERAMALVGRG